MPTGSAAFASVPLLARCTNSTASSLPAAVKDDRRQEAMKEERPSEVLPRGKANEGRKVDFRSVSELPSCRLIARPPFIGVLGHRRAGQGLAGPGALEGSVGAKTAMLSASNLGLGKMACTTR
eukprot:6897560-Prymnesium_polylepis.1